MPSNDKESYDYVVRVTAKGKLNKHLLRPRVHQELVRVSCEPPAKERLLWSQSSNSKDILSLPRSRILSDVRTHFVLVGTDHQVRLVLLDKNGYAILNHESVASEIFSTNQTLASV